MRESLRSFSAPGVSVKYGEAFFESAASGSAIIVLKTQPWLLSGGIC